MVRFLTLIGMLKVKCYNHPNGKREATYKSGPTNMYDSPAVPLQGSCASASGYLKEHSSATPHRFGIFHGAYKYTTIAGV
jgi:hypothetical protein